MADILFRLKSPSTGNQIIANQWYQNWDPASPAKSMQRWCRELDAARNGSTFWSSAELQVNGGGPNGGGSGATAAPATGTITFTSGSGSVGATIAGTTVTVTWATSDAASAANLVIAINNNTTINPWVTASLANTSSTTPASVILTANTLPWDNVFGNLITLVASGTGVTVSGAKLAGGVNSDQSQVVNL